MAIFSIRSFKKTKAMNAIKSSSGKKQKGFLVAYVTYGVALLVALGVAYGKLNETKSYAKQVDEKVEQIVNSFVIYSQRIESCTVTFPAGDHGLFDSLIAYPAPNTVDNVDLISNVVCPGVDSGINTLNRFGYLPPPPTGFDAWEYQHTEAGGVNIILPPAVANGESVVRRRVERRLQSGYSVTPGPNGELVMNLISP